MNHGTQESQGNYIVITPVRDEEQYLENTINSMINQVVLPKKWVIVNDGSTDNTIEIIQKHSDKKWIKLINRENRGFRKLGSGVIDAFNEGHDSLTENEREAEYLVKLDADVSFGPEYFSTILIEFEKDSRLGIASGQSYAQYDTGIIIERTNPDHARGPSKIYRTQCLKEIGWLVSHLGWDTIDEITAQMNGWKTKCIPAASYIHHRPTASSTGLWIIGKYREGYTSYYLDYHPFYFLLRCVRQLFEKPRIIGSLFLFFGWFLSLIQFKEKYGKKSVRKYLRKKQSKRMFMSSI